MAAPKELDVQNIEVWVNGVPYSNLNEKNTKSNSFDFWVDGIPYVSVYEDNKNNGGFFMMFPMV